MANGQASRDVAPDADGDANEEGEGEEASGSEVEDETELLVSIRGQPGPRPSAAFTFANGVSFTCCGEKPVRTGAKQTRNCTRLQKEWGAAFYVRAGSRLPYVLILHKQRC